VNFKNRAKSTDLFNSNKDVYDIKEDIKARPLPPKKKN